MSPLSPDRTPHRSTSRLGGTKPTLLFAPTMTVYLVRHAVAVGRSDWKGDDSLRPLTKRGERQASGLVELLAGADVQRVLSSPAVRCRETVEPLASKIGLSVQPTEVLAEGARPK